MYCMELHSRSLLPHLKRDTVEECHYPRPGYERVSVPLKERVRNLGVPDKGNIKQNQILEQALA